MMTEPKTAKAKRTSSDDSTTTSKGTVLVVEDEHDLQELLRYNLEREGYRVVGVMRGEQALEEVEDRMPDLVLLDLMLPGMDGLEVCRAIRGNPDTATLPVVMLTAKGEEADIVTGLELGADDYIVKPFSPRVLLARLKAVMRRRRRAAERDEGTIIRVGELEVDPGRHEVRIEGESITLTQTEFRIVQLLAGKPGRVFTRAQIVASVQGDHVAVTDRSVDVHIVSLRRKLGDAGTMIQTVRGVGYRFEDK